MLALLPCEELGRKLLDEIEVLHRVVVEDAMLALRHVDSVHRVSLVHQLLDSTCEIY